MIRSALVAGCRCGLPSPGSLRSPPSPARGEGRDGGNIGCRYTPEMIEMGQKALELRAKGIIKF